MHTTTPEQAPEHCVLAAVDLGEYDVEASLDELEERLGAPFVRTHRSFLVNAERIREVNYEEMTVLLDDGSRALLSRTGKSRLRQVMEK